MNPFSKTMWLGVSLAGLLATSCTSRQTAVADFQIVPMPLEITAAQQASFLLHDGVAVCYPAGNEMMKKNAEFLVGYISEQTGIQLTAKEGEGAKGDIVLALGLKHDNPEAYQLKVTGDQIIISGPSEAGVFYGIQTLRKSVAVAQGTDVEVPAVEINDEPRFSYRGMMLDVGRHFFTMDEIKTYIDILALHNAPASDRVTRVRSYSGYTLKLRRFVYGTITLCGLTFQSCSTTTLLT